MITPWPILGPMTSKEGPPTRSWGQWFSALRDGVNASPQVTGEVALTAQQASISATALPLPALTNCCVRVSVFSRITRPATTSSSVQVTIGGTDGGVAYPLVGTALTGNTTATVGSQTWVVSADAGSSVTYAVSYSSVGATAAQFGLTIIGEVLP